MEAKTVKASELPEGAAILDIPYTLDLALALSILIKCQHCGWCCQNPAILKILQRDLIPLAAYCQNTPDEFVRKYQIKDDYMTVKPCPFYRKEEKGCTVQPAKPTACRCYPIFHVSIPGEAQPRLAIWLHCPAGKHLLSLLCMEPLGPKIEKEGDGSEERQEIN